MNGCGVNVSSNSEWKSKRYCREGKANILDDPLVIYHL